LAAPTLAYSIAALHVAHVCTSRLYVGVHSVADLVGGLLVGLLVIASFANLLQLLDSAAFSLVAASPVLGGVVVILCCLIPCLLLYPDVRASNTAWSESVQFCGVYLGITIGSATFPHVPLLCPPSTLSPGAVAVQYFAGIVLLGVSRTLMSESFKLLLGGTTRLKPIDKSGRPRETFLNVARSFMVTILTASLVAAVPPPCSWMALW